MTFLDAARAFVALGILGAGLLLAACTLGGFLKVWDGEGEPGDGAMVVRAAKWSFVLIALGLLFCHWAFDA